ncbi:TPA: autotransporter outer membrane beta-barrel domain-containing protein, partial [Escherichia coli]|nr:autotransporter outer membrane beta-barrel domain-containing protein [Escherichia coli]
DRIDILNKATGGHNTLDLSSLFDQTVTLKNDLTLASAPVGTSHGYFSFASLNRGFTVYTPDTQVQEKDGRVYWQLKNNAGLADSQAQPVSENEIRKVAADGDSGNNRADESGSAVSGKSSEVTVKGSSLFKGADNTS